MGQRRLGRHCHLRGDTGPWAAVRVSGPAGRQGELPVEEGVPAWTDDQEIDPDLGVVDPAGRAGVLAGHPNGVPALRPSTGLLGDQHRVGAA